MSTTTVKKSVKKKVVASENDANDIMAQLTIEQNARAFNRSATANTSLNKFVNGEFKVPKMFQDNNFKDFVKEMKQGIGLVGVDEMAEKLNAIVASKVDAEVESKIKSLSKLPLTKEQQDKLEAAKILYHMHLSVIVSNAKKMISEI